MMMFWIPCGAGVDHDHLVKLASKHFGGMSAGYEGEIPMLPPCRFTGSEVGSVLHWLLLSVNVVQLRGMDLHRLIRYCHPHHPSLHNKHCLSCSHSDLISMFLPHPLPQAVLTKTFHKRDHIVGLMLGRSSVLLSAHSV